MIIIIIIVLKIILKRHTRKCTINLINLNLHEVNLMKFNLSNKKGERNDSGRKSGDERLYSGVRAYPPHQQQQEANSVENEFSNKYSHLSVEDGGDDE